MEEIQMVRSKDGVDIAFSTSGRGPHLVLVHGTSADRTRWRPVLPMFEKHFTVCAVDRRGRGGSGDAQGYSVEREYDDVAAICDSLDGPVHLLGHSFGALCSLEAALRTQNLRKLVLYEPPVIVDGYTLPAGVVGRLKQLLAQGDREGVLATQFREIVKMPESELAVLRSDPSWKARLAAAHTVPREMDLSYVLDAARFRKMKTPTLLLLGSESPPFLEAATRTVKAALPDSQVVVLRGQAHAAITTAPRLFAEEVLRFLLA